jgi:predicted Zn-dependent protease
MIVESPDIDARSVPGGRLLFFRGLLDFVTSEAALVGILGHELAHLDHGHQLKPLQHQQLAQQKLQQFGTGNPPHFSDMFDFAKMSAGSFHPIHPEEEKQADADATLWLYKLGYDPAELARLFNQLADRAGGQDRMVPSFLRTHPLMRDRARDVLQQLEKLQQARPKANLVVGQAALQTRTPAPLP